MKRSQSGLSMTGFLTVLIIVGFVLWIGMKLLPIYIEYGKIREAMTAVAKDDTVPNDPISIRGALEKRFDMNDVYSVKPADIRLNPEKGGQKTLEIDYESRKNLIANMDMVATFHIKEPE